MPIFEYECLDCGTNFEKIVHSESTVDIECPTCQCARLKKIITSCSFQFKGSGFHETDYKNQGK